MPLTKKQIQQWVMGAIGVAIAFFVIIQFAVVPMIAAMKDNRGKTRALREELDKASEAIGRGAEYQRNLSQTRAEISALATNIPLPVLGNYLLGMDQQIRSCCSGLNMQITSVADCDVINLADWNSLFKIYRVRVVGQAGINDLARCFHAIQKRNPLTSVASISIVPQDGIPDIHNVNFVVGWLIWADPNKRPEFLMVPEPKAPTPTPASKR